MRVIDADSSMKPECGMREAGAAAAVTSPRLLYKPGRFFDTPIVRLPWNDPLSV